MVNVNIQITLKNYYIMIIKTKFDDLIFVNNKKFNASKGYFKELTVEKISK